MRVVAVITEEARLVQKWAFVPNANVISSSDLTFSINGLLTLLPLLDGFDALQ